LLQSYLPPSIGPSNSPPWDLPKVVEKKHPHKNLSMDVYSSFIHHCPILEETKINELRLSPDNRIVIRNLKTNIISEAMGRIFHGRAFRACCQVKEADLRDSN
jgi:hypothetical protein